MDLLKQQLLEIMKDVGWLGWFIFGCYIAIFAMSLMIKVLDARQKTFNRNLRERQKEVRQLKRESDRRRRNEYYVSRAAYYRQRNAYYINKGRRY